ncbi:hypothetical protein VaNZ11_004733 [Volvox africanus]|uniref:Uncharacterized protein n=1 Tax=Volvox africanus TaxID=51714 RepID=A0ABQ5RXH2_9CHLO|nr:hypothetical protein VaNZ11_004733 [Volvox africanus]
MMTSSLLGLLMLLCLSRPFGAASPRSSSLRYEDAFKYNNKLMSASERGHMAESTSMRSSRTKDLEIGNKNLVEDSINLRSRQRFLVGTVKQNSSCILVDDTCTTDLRYFASLQGEPSTSIQKLIARSISDNCYPEDATNVSARGCPTRWIDYCVVLRFISRRRVGRRDPMRRSAFVMNALHMNESA